LRGKINYGTTACCLSSSSNLDGVLLRLRFPIKRCLGFLCFGSSCYVSRRCHVQTKPFFCFWHRAHHQIKHTDRQTLCKNYIIQSYFESEEDAGRKKGHDRKQSHEKTRNNVYYSSTNNRLIPPWLACLLSKKTYLFVPIELRQTKK